MSKLTSELPRILTFGELEHFLTRMFSQINDFGKSLGYITFIGLIPKIIVESFSILSLVLYFNYTTNESQVYQLVLLGLSGMRILPGLQGMFTSLNTLRVGTETIEKLLNVTNNQNQNFLSVDESSFPKVNPQLFVSSIGLQYEIDLQVTFRHGLNVLVGSQSGKSTLVRNLICSLIAKNDCRKDYIYIPQSIKLLKGNIPFNLNYCGDDDYLLKQCKLLKVDSLLTKDDVSICSTGQGQRISLLSLSLYNKKYIFS